MSIFWLGEQHTETELISEQIADKSNSGQSQREFLSTVISEFSCNPKRKYMDIAQNYYENNNDIQDARRTVIGKDYDNNAILMESKVLSNNKLNHNFMKKLTRQKIGYMLGKPFTLASINAKDARSEAMFEAVQKYFDMNFYKLIKNIGRDSIVKGIAWLMVYYNENGELKFKRCAPEEIIPFWKDSDHTELDAVVRRYNIEQYTGGDKVTIKKAEYYTTEGVWYYVYNKDGKLVPDPDATINPSSQFYLGNGAQRAGANWARIPFIPFKYDPDEQSLLVRIKSLIDDYDKKTSGISNNVDDFPNSVIVVKNYDGRSKEEFVQNKNEYRTIFVQGDGDAKPLETPLNISEVDKHIQRLREDIYEFGQGVNTADKDIRDTSGVALRFMYADLDMDCVDWGAEVQWSIMSLIWFINQDIIAKSGEDYSDVKYTIIFNTDVIINEAETINNAAISVGVISGETIAENHPWTKDAMKEIEAMRAEQGESLNLEAEYGEKMNNGLSGQRVSVGQG